jgi:hypothetical protein
MVADQGCCSLQKINQIILALMDYFYHFCIMKDSNAKTSNIEAEEICSVGQNG